MPALAMGAHDSQKYHSIVLQNQNICYTQPEDPKTIIL